MRKIFLLILFIVGNTLCYSIQKNIEQTADSLLSVIKNTKTDTAKIIPLASLADLYYGTDFVKTKEYATEALNLALKHEKKEKAAGIYLLLGNNAYIQSSFDFALINYQKAAEIFHSLNKPDLEAVAISNMGLVFINKGDLGKGLEFQLKALKIYKKSNNKNSLAGCYNAVAVIYKEKKDYKKALHYQLKSLELNKQLKNQTGIANNYVNIGNIYLVQKNFKKAERNYLAGLAVAELEKDNYSLGTLHHVMGALYYEREQYTRAEFYLTKAIEFQNKANDIHGIAETYIYLGLVFSKMEKYAKAIEYSEKGLKLSQENGLYASSMNAHKSLADVYEITGNTGLACRHLKLHVKLKDSLQELENKQHLGELREKFDTESKEKEILSLQNKSVKDELNNQKERNLRNLVLAGLVIVFVFLVLFYLRFKAKQKSSNRLQQAYTVIREKQKEIVDSITYAKRIQTAMLPSPGLIATHLPQSFVFYKPKDIVAGDFYWFEKTNTHVFIAAADCTGHGVPGAMVSVICHGALNRAVREFKLTDPGQILDKTRELVIAEFEKSDEDVKDGMDISLLAIEMKPELKSEIRNAKFENGNNSLTSEPVSYLTSNISCLKWAGANNPLWLVRRGELIEYKANKQPIGKYGEALPFTTHTVEVKEHDCLYLFTDGYQDQFGGSGEGKPAKKYKAAQLKTFISLVSTSTLPEQKIALENEFNRWKDDLEQLDDVCVVGIKV